MYQKDSTTVTVLELLESMQAYYRNASGPSYLCIACRNHFSRMTGVGFNKQTSQCASSRLIKWMEQQLAGAYTYETWMRLNHTAVSEKMDATIGSYTVGRKLWIDAMIAHLKEHGE